MNPSKRTLRGILLGLVIASLPMLALATDTFSDVPDDYFAHDQINNIAGAGVTAGCGGTSYCPDQAVTRGQMAIFVNRAGPKIAFDGTSPSGVPVDADVTPEVVATVTIGGNGGAGGTNMVKVDATFTNLSGDLAVFQLTDGTDNSRDIALDAGESGALTWAVEMASDGDLTLTLTAFASTTTASVAGELTAIQGLFGPDGGNALVPVP